MDTKINILHIIFLEDIYFYLWGDNDKKKFVKKFNASSYFNNWKIKKAVSGLYYIMYYYGAYISLD